MASRCCLQSLTNGCNDVTISGSGPVTVGRTRDTCIKDKKCSREQVEITCNLSNYSCSIKQLGPNSAAVNNVELKLGQVLVAKHGDTINILTGKYTYLVVFDPPDPSVSSGATPDMHKTPNSSAAAANGEPQSCENNKNKSLIMNIDGTSKTGEINTKNDTNILTETTSSSSTKHIKNSSAKISKDKIKDSSKTFRDSNSKSSSKMIGNGTTKPTGTSKKTGTLNPSSTSTSPPSTTAPPPKEAPTKKRSATDPAAANISSKKAKLGMWSSVENGDLLIYNQHSLPGAVKVAAYDMDGTLIVTQSGRVFPTDYNDWKIIFSEVPGKLKELHKQDYKIIIFTNQAGISSGKSTLAGIQGKMEKIIARLGVPLQAFVSTGRGRFRKPTPTMWRYMEDNCNAGVPVDRTASMYIGDAAGRPEVKKVRKKDFSFADRLFALNVGVAFRTPEEHFLNRKTEQFTLPDFDPRTLTDLPQYDPPGTKVPADKAELVVLCGFPASGKSVFATNVLSKLGYQHANRDILGSWQKCVTAVQTALKAGQSIVVDNTNPDRESRSRYVKIAQQLNCPARCFVLNVTKDHSRHNNKFREFTDPTHAKVSDMIFNMYNVKYQPPTVNEGFSEIVSVNFVPHFRSSDDEELYRMFLVEK